MSSSKNRGFVTPQQSFSSLKHAVSVNQVPQGSGRSSTPVSESMQFPSLALQMLPIKLNKRSLLEEDGLSSADNKYCLGKNPGDMDIINGFIFGNSPQSPDWEAVQAESEELRG